MDEPHLGVSDIITAELVECGTPEPVSGLSPCAARGADVSLMRTIQDATITQTGSGPPPDRE